MASLQDILYGISIDSVIGTTSLDVTSIHFDSREVKVGSVFVAVRGAQVDGHEFISKAIELGAKVIIGEEFKEVVKGITYVQTKSSALSLGVLASNFYGNPSKDLNLVGVTGTNGKTSTVTLLFNLFRDLGYNVGLLSTVENKINNAVIPSTHTTPNPIALNELLRQMVAGGCTYCFMEVSSHAIVQGRINGLVFKGGVFSNITHDHLDYHGTFKEYIRAKKLFFDYLPKSAFALYNADDRNGSIMVQNTKATIYSYGLKSMADFKVRILENTFHGLFLNVDGEELSVRLIGEFNAYNVLAAYSVAILLEEDKQEVLASVSNLNTAEGRFDYILSKDKCIGVVDYAHTPDALKQVLHTIKGIRQGNEKIYTIVGCGGDRDISKRPLMAQIAAELSDMAILTSDNPRSEAPDLIIEDMKAGLNPVTKTKSLSITDRREAIKTACALAQAGDIILLAGKGHEKYQDINGVKHPFDDKEELVNAFKQLGK